MSKFRKSLRKRAGKRAAAEGARHSNKCLRGPRRAGDSGDSPRVPAERSDEAAERTSRAGPTEPRLAGRPPSPASRLGPRPATRRPT